MKTVLQSVLLQAYALMHRTGFFATTPGRALFEFAYQQYKTWIEVGDVRVLRAFIPAGSTVVDVGANIGFFVRQFAPWVGPQGRVIALEPEAANFARLQRFIEKRGWENIVEPVQAAAAEQAGTLMLAINPLHPADHKLAAEGVPVAVVTLDGLLAERGWPTVSFLKIDVQGAESRVLAGAAQTLSRFRPALFIEVDDAALQRMGSSAAALHAHLGSLGYAPRRICQGKLSAALPPSELLATTTDGRYTDLLFLHAGNPLHAKAGHAI